MLEQELEGIDSEIIFDEWQQGVHYALGDFVCLLQPESAVKKDSIRNQLKPFIDSPRYRKLVMVSPSVEFEDTAPMILESDSSSHNYHLIRIGCVGGSVIRKTSLLKHVHCLDTELMVDMSYALSVTFWENGLRVMHDPQSLYYSPDEFTPAGLGNVSEKVSELWHRECIA